MNEYSIDMPVVLNLKRIEMQICRKTLFTAISFLAFSVNASESEIDPPASKPPLLKKDTRGSDSLSASHETECTISCEERCKKFNSFFKTRTSAEANVESLSVFNKIAERCKRLC